MIVHFDYGLKRYQADLSRPISIAIRQSFGSRQVNHFNAERARCQPVRMGEFVGSTRLGGSCNVDQVSLIPHCNGTHVEHVGHIVNSVDGNPLSHVPPLMLAILLSVEATGAAQVSEAYRPPLDPFDRVVTAGSLQAARANLKSIGPVSAAGLILRTLPNDENKMEVQYAEKPSPPFLTVDAIEWIIERGVEHLLVDFPSIDRVHDDGRLTNHHLFWEVAEQHHELPAGAMPLRSITELIFVPGDVADGVYLLNLQFPDWATDAVPARPLLFRVHADDGRS